MEAKRIIVVDNQKYMSTKTAADCWGLKPKTVADYCRNNRIKNKFKNGNKGWYIRIDEIKPLSSDEIHKILVLSLQLKNNPDLEIDWSTFNFDYSAIKVVYKNLVSQGYVKDFSIEDEKMIPYKVILTQKGMECATCFRNMTKKSISDFSTTVQQWAPIVIGIAQVVCQITQMH